MPGGCSATRPSSRCWSRAANRSPWARRKRRATKAQRRALLHRDGGCARPGCTETRIERLHAHHMRHWLFGGRTDLRISSCSATGTTASVHDLDLVMTRRDGALVVTTPDGRTGLGRRQMPPSAADWTVSASWSAAGRAVRATRSSASIPSTPRCAPPGAHRAPSGRSDRSTRPGHADPPHGPAARPPSAPRSSPAASRRYPTPCAPTASAWTSASSIGVLMGNRDLVRRLAAEQGVPAGTCLAGGQMLAPSGGRSVRQRRRRTPTRRSAARSMPTV